MKRPKIGDLFAIKLFNGYKLLQWAYDIPRVSDFVRVFDGLYSEIPENLSEIVAGPHSYIIGFHIKWMYRIGLAQLLGSYPVPEKYPYPDLSISFNMDMSGEIYRIKVEHSLGGNAEWTLLNFPVSRMEDLPHEYRSLTLIGRNSPSADWMLYLFDTNFNLTDLRKYYVAPPGNGEYVSHTLQPYTDLIENALRK